MGEYTAIKQLSCPCKRAFLLRGLWIPVFAGMTVISSAWATPPTEMDLSYDPAQGTLHVEAKHVSDHLDKHYLRRLLLYRNGVQEQELTYTRQKYPSKFIEDIPLIAKPGEIIAVEVFCSQGGSKRAELTIDSTSTSPAPAPPVPENPRFSPKSTSRVQ